jgi:hypothetical protein
MKKMNCSILTKILRNDADIESQKMFPRVVILIFILGLTIRLFAAQNIFIINPDGALYIHQARALYYGLWHAINTCGIQHLTIYQILIAATYGVSGDWVISARFISVLFGTLTLIPLYLLSRRLFETSTSALITLIFAVSPVFVSSSVDIIRDPAYWFFTVFGFYFFARQIDEKNFFHLLLSSIFFFLATWLRIEATLFIIVSTFYIILIPQEDKWKKFIVFSIPIAVILFLFVAGQIILRHSGHIYWYRLQEIVFKLSSSINAYLILENNLTELVKNPPLDIPFEFIFNVKTLLWFIGLGTILNNAMEAFFYPFFFIFLIGLPKIWQRARERRVVLYFTLLSFSAPILLYFYVFTNWSIENRYLALMILPSFVFFGFGLEKSIYFLTSRYHLKKHIAISILCLLILIFALPRDMSPKEADKAVFKQIGEMIAETEGGSNEIDILTLGDSTRWISFYANLHVKGAPCPETRFYHKNLIYIIDNHKKMIGNSYEEFDRNVRLKGVKYILWEENRWPKQSFDLLNRQDTRKFVKIGSWSHQDTGKLILFKVL